MQCIRLLKLQQSTGSLHAHSQVVVLCLHQHTCLSEVLQHVREQPGDIIKEKLNCKTHVIRQVYETDPEELHSEFDAHEKAWPEYKDSLFLNNLPPCFHATPRTFASSQEEESKASLHEEGKALPHSYLHEDVEQLHMMKQHHVHLRNPDTNLREPPGASEEKTILNCVKLISK